MDRGRCPACGRRNEHITPFVLTLGGYTARAPWCNEQARCPTLSVEERKDPDLCEYQTRLTPKMIESLDPGIRERVLRAREKGWSTLFSCDGHGKHDAYITFWDAAHRDEAMSFFGGTAEDKQSRLLGPLYNLRFPRD